MNVAYSQIDIEFRESVEKECARHVEKLNRILKRYTPDTIQLHVSLEKTPRRVEYNSSLNLTLPTGVLHATGSGESVRSSAKAAFAEIESQLKKHQQKLRKDYIWKRKRGRGAVKLTEIPLAD
jgi:ribosomal subunit interface protein